MYEVKAIETEYNGYRFRSRTEARWAVFFDYLGEPYEYEKECFQLPSGKYLPDFFLPKKNLWVEIKGKEPTIKEWKKCVELFQSTGENVLCLWGTPGNERGRMLTVEQGFFEVTRVCYLWDMVKFYVIKREVYTEEDKLVIGEVEGFLNLNDEYKHFFEWTYSDFYSCHYLDAYDYKFYEEAVAYSRQARFEGHVKNPREINGTRN